MDTRNHPYACNQQNCPTTERVYAFQTAPIDYSLRVTTNPVAAVRRRYQALSELMSGLEIGEPIYPHLIHQHEMPHPHQYGQNMYRHNHIGHPREQREYFVDITNSFPNYQNRRVPTHPPTPSLASMSVSIENEDMWKALSKLDNEMIVTRNGRCLFPRLGMRLSGLDPTAKYYLRIAMSRVGDCRFKYSGEKQWDVAGKADQILQDQYYYHPESPNTGAHWMEKAICFHRLKITNNRNKDLSEDNKLTLISMNQYQPVLHVIQAESLNGQWITHTLHYFEDAKFIAVTAYQSSAVNEYKTAHNVFSKGQRPKRKRNSVEDGPLEAGVEAKSRKLDVSFTVNWNPVTETDDKVDDESSTSARMRSLSLSSTSTRTTSKGPSTGSKDDCHMSADERAAGATVGSKAALHQPWSKIDEPRRSIPSPQVHPQQESGHFYLGPHNQTTRYHYIHSNIFNGAPPSVISQSGFPSGEAGGFLYDPPVSFHHDYHVDQHPASAHTYQYSNDAANVFSTVPMRVPDGAAFVSLPVYYPSIAGVPSGQMLRLRGSVPPISYAGRSFAFGVAVPDRFAGSNAIPEGWAASPGRPESARRDED